MRTNLSRTVRRLAMTAAVLALTLFAARSQAAVTSNGLNMHNGLKAHNGLFMSNGLNMHNGLKTINGLKVHNGMSFTKGLSTAKDAPASTWRAFGIDPRLPLAGARR
jgi:hypothetical protein